MKKMKGVRMHKVFLADDEIWVVRGLLRRIDWKRLGCEVVGYARDGLEAKEKILQLARISSSLTF